MRQKLRSRLVTDRHPGLNKKSANWNIQWRQAAQHLDLIFKPDLFVTLTQCCLIGTAVLGFILSTRQAHLAAVRTGISKALGQRNKPTAIHFAAQYGHYSAQPVLSVFQLVYGFALAVGRRHLVLHLGAGQRLLQRGF